MFSVQIAIRGWSSLLLFLCACLHGAESTERKAWQYTQGAETVTIANTSAKEWTANRADGRKLTYEETSRTAEFIELRNSETRLRLRLHASGGFWRRESEEDWKRWMNGRWVAPVPITAATKQPTLPSQTNTAMKLVATPATPSTKYQVRLGYFVPRDRKPIANYEQKIRVVMSVVSDLYRTDLQGKGLKTSGFAIESDAGSPKIHLIRGAQPASHYNDAPDYRAAQHFNKLVPEIRAVMGDPDKHVMVVFSETYDPGPSPFLWPGVIARGAYNSSEGGLAVYTSHILRDEFCALSLENQRKIFFDETPVNGRRALGHKQNSARFEFAEDGFGAVAHELGHAFGLPHDRREDAREIMGNGFRNLRWNYAGPAGANRKAEFSAENALLLMSSRYLASDLILSDNQPAVCEMKLNASRGSAPIASIKVSDNIGLRGVVFVDENAASIVSGRRLSGKSQEFVEKLPASVIKDGEIQIRAIVTDDGGNQTRVSQTLRLSPASK